MIQGSFTSSLSAPCKALIIFLKAEHLRIFSVVLQLCRRWQAAPPLHFKNAKVLSYESKDRLTDLDDYKCRRALVKGFASPP